MIKRIKKKTGPYASDDDYVYHNGCGSDGGGGNHYQNKKNIIRVKIPGLKKIE